MATAAAPVQNVNAQSEGGWRWFARFLRQELAPYPGRGWLVARMIIAATLMMLCIMVFRMPNASLGVYYTLLFSRDSAQATIRSVIRSVSAVGVSLLYITVTVRLFAGDPILHFLWVAGTLFITFFLIDSLTEYLAGTAFGFLAVTSISAWDFPANTDVLFGNTLWTALAVVVGALITTAVELIARSIYPTDEFTERLADRVRSVEDMTRCIADGKLIGESERQRLAQYAMTGTSALRQQLARSTAGASDTARISAVVALVGRLVDVAAHVVAQPQVGADSTREAWRETSNRLSEIRQVIESRQFRMLAELPTASSNDLRDPFLTDIQTTINRIPEVFSGLTPLTEYLPSAIDFNRPKKLFKDDAFTNVEHIRFALKGTLAALSCYLLYNSIDWRGLSPSVATCMITALSTVGSSRQKQILRVSGAFIGAVCLGITSQIFFLPHMDNIAEFTVLFVAVTAFAAWITTSSPHISYAGAQTGFAFYLTQLRGFGPQISLTAARDDVMGIMLGLGAMWITFDRIWAKDTLAEMLDAFVANMRRIACYDSIAKGELRLIINKARVERATIQSTFDQIRNISDSLIFEFGENWQRKLVARNQMRKWQPQLRTYFIVQVGLLHFRLMSADRSIEPAAEDNVQKSERILSLLADLADRHKEREANDIRQQVKELLDKTGRNSDREEGEQPSQPLRLSRSMLEVSLSLANDMIAQ